MFEQLENRYCLSGINTSVKNKHSNEVNTMAMALVMKQQQQQAATVQVMNQPSNLQVNQNQSSNFLNDAYEKIKQTHNKTGAYMVEHNGRFYCVMYFDPNNLPKRIGFIDGTTLVPNTK